GVASAADSGRSPPSAAASSGTLDAELFVTLRGLLASQRGEPVARTPPKERAGAYVPSSDAIQSVLAKLQSKPVIPAGNVAGHSATQLKQDLLDQLRAF